MAFTIMCAYNNPSKSNQDNIRKSHAMLITSNNSVYMIKLKLRTVNKKSTIVFAMKQKTKTTTYFDLSL